MATEIKIPIPDQTTEEVRIVKWKKAEGDTVAKGDVVLEVETDKSVMEVESPEAGTLLKQLFPEDESVPVGKIVAYIGAAGTVIPDTVEAASSAGQAAPVVSTPAPPAAVTAIDDSSDRIKASPIARRIAQERGINLSQVTGSGPKGRIVREDVENFTAPAAAPAVRKNGRIFASPFARKLAREMGLDLRQIAGTGPNGRIIAADVKKYAASGAASAAVAAPAAVSLEPAPGQPQPGTEEAITKLRRAIGKNLQMSFRDTPHFNVTMSINMTRAIAFRKQYNQGLDKPDRLSVNDLIVKAVAVALRQYPAVNSRFTEEKITYHAEVNVGVATAIETGLVVPVLTDADKRNWADMAKETKRLAGEARNGKILGAGKGTFTVSNLGMFGVDEFTAIINPPESAILAVGGTKDEVIAINGMIGIQPMMKVTLCSDHRIIDGALAAQFLTTVKKYLEEKIS
jgi:pyruvate dehydrogenase E2 component (dihydrolipoamide acetyltransferase)